MESFDEKLNKIVWRRPASKKKRKKILSKKIWLGGGIFLVILAMAGGLFFAPIFKIKEIIVSGDTDGVRSAVESFIRSYLYYRPLTTGGGNILFLDGKELAEKIKQEFPRTEEARIKKDFLERTLSIKLTEKKSIGIWCVDPTPCFYLEKGGSIFEEAPQVEGSLILLIKTRGISEMPEIGGKAVEENFLNFILKIKEDLFSSADVNVKEFLLRAGSFDVEAVTAGGFRIFFDGRKNPAEQITNLKIMLEEKIKEGREELEYIDLREGSRIYYKLKEGE